MTIKGILITTILILLFGAGCEEVLETDLTGKKVVLLAPVNNLITSDTLQTFYCEKLDGAGRYQLQVMSPRFDSIVHLIVDTPVTNNTFILDLNINTYQWRVKAINNSSSSDFSETWNLKIQ